MSAPNETGNLLSPGKPLVPSQADIDKLTQLANAYYGSEKGGCTYGEKCRSPEGYFVKMMIGLSLGIDPTTAVSEIASSKNGHSMSAALKMTIARRRGLATIEIIETDAEHAVVKFRREDWVEGREGTVLFALADAKRAGLLGKDNWRHWPQEMLVHGAERRVCNIYLPDVTLGCGYTHDEVGRETDVAGKLVEFTPVTPAAGFGGGRDAVPAVAPPSKMLGPFAAPAVTPPPSPPSPPVAEEPVVTADDLEPEGEGEEASEPPAPCAVDGEQIKNIARLVDKLGYTSGECRQRFAAWYGAVKLASLTPERTAQFEAKLVALDRLHALRDVAQQPTDEQWTNIVLPNKGVSHDLDLTAEQIEEIHAKLFDKATPYNVNKGAGSDADGSTAKNALAPALPPPA